MVTMRNHVTPRAAVHARVDAGKSQTSRLVGTELTQHGGAALFVFFYLAIGLILYLIQFCWLQ